MRIYEIAPGEKQSFSLAKPENYKNILRDNCSEVLSVIKSTGKFLYRGVYNYPSAVFAGSPRLDRESLSEKNPQFLKIFNFQCLQAGFGVNRLNSISTTSNKDAARAFGSVFYIFPINGFKFMWSPRIEDFGIDVYVPKSELNQNQNYVEAFGYTNTNFSDALKSGYEISIHGNYYAFMRHEFGDESEFAEFIGIK